jgi:hypothetical protein
MAKDIEDEKVMNDFTKEQLLIILLDLENKNPNPTSKVQVILNKIKSMIDNYENPSIKIKVFTEGCGGGKNDQS